MSWPPCSRGCATHRSRMASRFSRSSNSMQWSVSCIASRSRLDAQSVILKGALLLKTIGIPNARPTMDIDMLRKGKADQASLVALIKDCATLEVEADGLTFLDNTVAAEEITKD